MKPEKKMFLLVVGVVINNLQAIIIYLLDLNLVGIIQGYKNVFIGNERGIWKY